MTMPRIWKTNSETGKTTITVQCAMHLGDPVSVTVDTQDYVDWTKGVGEKRLAQVAFPYICDDERELLISGICGKCYDAFLGEEE